MVPLGISDPQEVLDDQTLQYLSVLCPEGEMLCYQNQKESLFMFQQTTPLSSPTSN